MRCCCARISWSEVYVWYAWYGMVWYGVCAHRMNEAGPLWTNEHKKSPHGFFVMAGNLFYDCYLSIEKSCLLYIDINLAPNSPDISVFHFLRRPKLWFGRRPHTHNDHDDEQDRGHGKLLTRGTGLVLAGGPLCRQCGGHEKVSSRNAPNCRKRKHH